MSSPLRNLELSPNCTQIVFAVRFLMASPRTIHAMAVLFPPRKYYSGPSRSCGQRQLAPNVPGGVSIMQSGGQFRSQGSCFPFSNNDPEFLLVVRSLSPIVSLTSFRGGTIRTETNVQTRAVMETICNEKVTRFPSRPILSSFNSPRSLRRNPNLRRMLKSQTSRS